MNTPDPFTDWDAAYVLGALSVADRRVFEEHLADCDRCRVSVSELAGMPGLLAGLPAADAIALASPPDDPNGAAELPPALAAMRAPHGVRQFRLPLALAVAVALVVGIALGGLGGYLIRDRLPAQTPTRVAFTPLHPNPMIAVADLIPTKHGTRINVDCQYAAGGNYSGTVDYILYVIGDSGQRLPGQRWSAGPGDRKMPKGWTGLALSQISALEIDYAGSGHPAMRAKL